MLGTAWGGGLRKLINFCISHSSWDAQRRLLDSIVEMQAFLVTLVRKFDISPADHHPQIRRSKTGGMAPLVLGEEYKGPQLPLKVTVIRNP